jgi:hypothetical protein
VGAILSFAMRSTLIQPAALVASATELNHHLVTGLFKAANPKEWERAHRQSNTLVTRSPDVSIYETMEDLSAGGRLKRAQRKAFDIGLMPLTILDKVAATATWLAAEAKAKKLGFEDVNKYADSIVDKTQASAARTNRSPIQRHIIGQTITGLQTFVINHWGWLTRDVLGINNAKMSNADVMARVTKFVVATTLMNAVYEDLIGYTSPSATPIRAYQETLDETDDQLKAMIAGTKELTEFIPVWGSTLKYGTQFGGPLVNTLLEMPEVLSKGEIPYKQISQLAGVPGTNQFSKSYRAYQREGDMWDIILGRYVEPTGGGRGSFDKFSKPSKASSFDKYAK